MSNINFCIIGIFASGKTSLAASFTKNKQSVANESTIGASFIVNYTRSSGGQALRLNIWDTAGQERYAMLLPMYSRNADVIIFTIDPINPDSVAYIKKMAPAVVSDMVVAIHLVVTKMDLQYGDANAKELVDELKTYFTNRHQDLIISDFYTSSMTCYNVEQPFITKCDEIIGRKVDRLTKSQTSTIIDITPSESQSKYDCLKCGV
jgi:Ras-related protein Rab-5C